MSSFFPAASVTKEDVIQVNNISITVPFTMLMSSIPFPLLYPTIIIASVAAACEVLKPKIICRSLFDILKIHWVTSAANHLLNIANAVKTPAIIKGQVPLKKAL